MAIELAKAVNCESHSGEACDTCSNCRRISLLQHPNIHLIFNLPVGRNETAEDSPLDKLSQNEISLVQAELQSLAKNPYYRVRIPKANAIKINSIREIRREASLTMFDGGKKFFIIIDAEKMNDPAANALLKTLEEPHQNTMLILITKMPDSLLPTIISRCQQIKFEPLAEETIRGALIQRFKVDQKTAHEVSGISGGSFAKALQLLESEYEAEQKGALDLLRSLLTKPHAEIVAAAKEAAKDKERQAMENQIRIMQQWFRDGNAIKQNAASESVTSDPTLNKFIRAYPDWDYVRSIQILDRAVSLLDKNVYIPLIVIDMAIKLKLAVGNRTSDR